MQEKANIVGQSKPPTNTPYGNTYNPNLRNHPNLSWKPQPPTYVPPGAQQQQPPTSSPVDQAILNLSKVVGNFIEEQKAINAQWSQKIENVEGSLNKRTNGLEGSLNQKVDKLQSSITRLTNQQQLQEQGRFPSQTVPNPRGVHERGFASNPTPRMDEVKVVITLRTGKQVDQPTPKPAEETREEEEVEPVHIFIKEDSMKNNMPPPFPQALRVKKKASWKC